MKLIIYGAGRIGRRVLASLRQCDSEICFFWDHNFVALGSVEGIPIREPDFNSIPWTRRQQYCVIVTVSARAISKQIGEQLRDLGYRVIDDRAVVNDLIYQNCASAMADHSFVFDLQTCHTCPVSKEVGLSCDIFDRYLSRALAQGVDEFESKSEKLVIPKIGLLVGNKCNLCCRGCNHLIDRSDPREAITFSSADLIDDVEKIVEVVDLINQVVVVGGEAFLHHDLAEILKRLLDLPKVGYIQIITNGSIKPKDRRVFELMSDERVIVEISGYGEELTQVLASRVQSFISELEHYNVNHYYMGALQWFNFGDFSFRSYDDEQHRQVYKTCCSVSHDIFNGRLYKCSRSALGTYLGHLPDFPTDYVDLRRSGPELKRELLRFLANDTPNACQYCNGAYLAMPAGIQTKRS